MCRSIYYLSYEMSPLKLNKKRPDITRKSQYRFVDPYSSIFKYIDIVDWADVHLSTGILYPHMIVLFISSFIIQQHAVARFPSSVHILVSFLGQHECL